MKLNKNIWVDMDSILVDLMKTWLGHYNKAYNDNLTLDKITNWNTSLFTKVECGYKIFGILHLPNLYRDLDPIPGAIEACTLMHEEGLTVKIATSAVKSIDIAMDKLLWLKKHLPWLKEGINFDTDKSTLLGDAFIDDGPHNIEAYRKNNPQAFIGTIGYGYNRGVKHLTNSFHPIESDEELQYKSAWIAIVQDLFDHFGIKKEVKL